MINIRTNISSNVTQQSNQPISPLSAWAASLLFGGSALLAVLAAYWFIPFLVEHGVPSLQAMLAAYCVPFAIFLAAAIAGYFGSERRPPERGAFAQRMWFNKITRRDLLWALALIVLGIVATGAMSLVERALFASGLIPVPAQVPVLIDPRVSLSTEFLEQAAGGPLAGQWGLALLFTVYLILNIAGEELWFRGYLLPRQVAQHGRHAWLVHALMWTGFHAFRYWSLLSVLPLALSMAYVSQRTRSNWPALISHLVGNSIFFFMILAGVIGL